MSEPNYHIKMNNSFKPVFPFFLEEREKDLVLLEVAIEKKDFQELMRHGHKLRGSAGGYGVQILATWGKELERNAKLHQFEKCKSTVEKIKNFLQNIRVEFI